VPSTRRPKGERIALDGPAQSEDRDVPIDEARYYDQPTQGWQDCRAFFRLASRRILGISPAC
jgi:hypothetical protein